MEMCKKYCSIIGAHFIMAPMSFLWVYGNLSEYTDSYFRFACAPRCTDSGSKWILPVMIAMACPGTLLSKYLADRIGLKWMGIVSSVFLNAALFGSTWTVKTSVARTILFLGVVLGLAQGITNVVVFQSVKAWAPKKATLLMATTSGAASLLSMIQNQVITAVVNPNNLKPDAMQGSRTFFSQPEVLDRVPTVLIVYAAMTFGLQTIGYLLLVPPPQDQLSSIPSEKLNGSSSLYKVEQRNMDDAIIEKKTRLNHSTAQDQKSNDHICKIGTYGSNESSTSQSNSNKQNFVSCSPENKMSQEISDLTLSQDKNTQPKEQNKKTTRYASNQTCALATLDTVKMKIDTTAMDSPAYKTDEQISLKPSEVLRSRDFYATFMFGIATVYALILKANFYKQFGLLYIHDDRYLTLVGTLIPLIASVSRLATGLALNEKFITIKDLLLYSLAINSFLCAFWYYVPQVSALLYLILILCLAMVQSLLFLTIPVVAMEMFGPKHFSTNLGFLLTTLLTVGILGPVVMSPILHALGWFWLFESASLLCLLAMVCVICADFQPLQPPV